MALVLGVSTASIVRREIFCESSSTSAKTGLAPAVTIELADARNVREVTITSSPVPMPRAFKAKSSATVPFATATAYWVCENAANSFSNSRHSCPVQ